MAEDDDWQFELSDLSDDEDDETDDEGNVAGAFAPTEDIEPESLVVEHAAFVAFGVFVSLVLFAGPLLGFSGRQIVIALVAAALAVAVVVAYADRTDGGDA